MQNIDNSSVIDNIINGLKKVGINFDNKDHFISLINSNEIEIIENFCLEKLFSVKEGEEEDKEKGEKNKFLIFQDDNINYKFNFEKSVAEGANNSVESYKSESVNNDINLNQVSVAVKTSILKGENELINIFMDVIISSILAIYQAKYLNLDKSENNYGKNIVPSVKCVGYNQTNNKIYLVMDLLDGSIKDILDENDNIFGNDIFFESLFQSCCMLTILQSELNFTHYDFKTANLFYKLKDPNLPFDHSNIQVFLGDFGNCSLQIENILIYGKGKALDIFRPVLPEFRPNKDLYNLFHTTIFECNFNKKKFLGDNFDETEDKQSFISFNLINFYNNYLEKYEEPLNVTDKRKKINISNKFNPINVMRKLIEAFPAKYCVKDCIKNFGKMYTSHFLKNMEFIKKIIE